MDKRKETSRREELIAAQFGHLPRNEWPNSGPIVDITRSIDQNAAQVRQLEETIREKRMSTAAWIDQHYPGKEPVFLTRPYSHKDFPPIVQQRLADWSSKIIRNVYGDGYPLPNIHPEFNLQGIQDGSLLLYFGAIGPRGTNNGNAYKDPLILMDHEVQPMASSAIVLGGKGFAELGRTARLREAEGFDGGSIMLERMYDWMRNRHRLGEAVHTLTSDMRGAAAHNGIPSSGAVQNIVLEKLGMKIRMATPMYCVKGLEPFLGVTKPRDLAHSRQVNASRTIYTLEESRNFVAALWEHQLGIPVSLNSLDYGAPHELATPTSNGGHIYGSVDVVDHEKLSSLDHNESRRVTTLGDAVTSLEKTSPVVIVKIDADTPSSLATQKVLGEMGYTVCGVEPAYDERYLYQNGSNELREDKFQSPPRIYMSKLGESVTRGDIPLARAYYPSPEDAHGVDLHGENLRRLLYETDERIRRAGNI